MGTGVTLPTKSPEKRRDFRFLILDFRFLIERNLWPNLNPSNQKSQIKNQKFKRDLRESNSNRFGQASSCKTRSVCCLSKFYGQAMGLIRSGQLSTLLHLHIHPINLVVYEESHWQD